MDSYSGFGLYSVLLPTALAGNKIKKKQKKKQQQHKTNKNIFKGLINYIHTIKVLLEFLI